MMVRSLRGFAAADDGSVTATVALVGSLLILAAIGTLEHANVVVKKHQLQNAADAAALNAIRAFRLAAVTAASVEDTATKQVSGNVPASFQDVTTTAVVNMAEKTISLAVTAAVPAVVFGAGATTIRVSAKAKASMGAPLCIMALETSQKSAMVMDKDAQVEASGCALYSNSRDKKGFRIANKAKINAALVCSGGGVQMLGLADVQKSPRSDCPELPDPLLSQTLPTAGACTYNNVKVKKAAMTLQPGVYCGGLDIGDKAKVTLAPGLYIMKDGKLKVDDGATLSGTNVSIHLSGAKSTIEIDSDTRISLTAPKSGGPMPGFLFTEDRAAPLYRQHVLKSEDAPVLLGTIYLPRGELVVGGSRPIAQDSAYTIVVARQFTLTEGPKMTFNVNYDSTDVPVPGGVGPSSVSGVLTQ